MKKSTIIVMAIALRIAKTIAPWAAKEIPSRTPRTNASFLTDGFR